jgi:hypothetical protein
VEKLSLPKSFREIQEDRHNRTLLYRDIEWDGESEEVEIEIPVSTQPVLIAINNVQGKELTATFDQKIILTPVGATATIGDPEVATITVTCETPGLEGEKYQIIVVNAEEEDAELSAELEDDLITVTLGTDEDGLPDDEKNTASLVATEIATIQGFTAEAVGSGVIVAFGEDDEPVQFSGGLSPTWASLYDSEGNQLSLTIAGETAKVFGTFDYFLRFYGGKIILTAAETPEADGLTTVIVQEV